ncbi:phospholipase A-2-activating protein-like [Diaphorina citri]|uniref:Phospholipase A-2-activating protein-like n=1 Tax=Diaphorina citri TaxID=121845 RepID=A0A3Q0J838_DIACI|nr:phospholipase A-2-activating protein-like [Diaphorina citri]
MYKLSTALYGHSMDVRSLSVTPDGCILSASRDKSAKLWKPNEFNANFTESITFKGHTNFVSCVTFIKSSPRYPSGLVVTGSNDKKILVFDPQISNPLFALTEHTNTGTLICDSPSLRKSVHNGVKDLILKLSESNPGSETDSRVNQCALKLVDIQCKLHREHHIQRFNANFTESITFKGHTNFVSCVTFIKSSPRYPSGLVVTGSNDKKILVFDPQIPNPLLPGKEVLYEPGKADGDVKMVREGSTVVAYSWSEASREWNKLGDVMGSAGGTQESSGKVLYQGKVNKLKQFTETLREKTDVSPSIVIPSEAQLDSLGTLGEPSPKAAEDVLNLLKQLLEWPPEFVFPILDLTRLGVRNVQINEALCGGRTGRQMISLLRSFLNADSSVNNQMLTLRILTNMFSHQPGEELVLSHKEYIFSILDELSHTKLIKSMQIALVSLLLNCIIAYRKRKDDASLTHSLEILTKMLPNLIETEALLRALIALGTLICDSPSLRKSVHNGVKDLILKLRNNSHANNLLDFDVDTRGAGSGALTVNIRAAGTEVKHTIRELDTPGVYQVVYQPQCAIPHRIIVKYNNMNISGMPEVTLTGMKNDIKVNLTSIGENIYRATYVPDSPGAYLLNVMWSDR